MPIDARYVGRSYPPTAPYEVAGEKIREFADALGDPNPVYRDAAAAKALGHPDVVAPPTFAFILTFRASRQVVEDPELGVDYTRVVHGEQRFSYVRQVRAGDRLVVVTTIDAIKSVAGNDILTTRGEVSTADGEPVLTAYSTLVVRAAPAEAGVG